VISGEIPGGGGNRWNGEGKLQSITEAGKHKE